MENIAIGYQSLFWKTAGDNNTAIGHEAMAVGNNTGNRNTALGHSALRANETGSFNTAIGSSALGANSTGINNVALGLGALVNNNTGNSLIGIGNGADVANDGYTNSIVIGNGAYVNASNKIRLGNTSITSAEIQVAWSVTSDARFKENIMPLTLGLDFIKALNPVSYSRIGDEMKTQEFGLIAQEMLKSLKNSNLNPEDLGLVSSDSRGYYAVRYNDLIPVLIKAIQEQQIIIEKLIKSLNAK